MNHERRGGTLEWDSTICDHHFDSVLIGVATGCIHCLFSGAMKEFQIFNEEGVNAVIDQISHFLLEQY